MDVAAWFLLIGGLLLAVGVIVGPTAVNAFHFNPLTQPALLEVLTEIAVLLSLFTAGMKMPIPVRLNRWRTPIFLAFVAMAISVGLIHHTLIVLTLSIIVHGLCVKPMLARFASSPATPATRPTAS